MELKFLLLIFSYYYTIMLCSILYISISKCMLMLICKYQNMMQGKFYFFVIYIVKKNLQTLMLQLNMGDITVYYFHFFSFFF